MNRSRLTHLESIREDEEHACLGSTVLLSMKLGAGRIVAISYRGVSSFFPLHLSLGAPWENTLWWKLVAGQ